MTHLRSIREWLIEVCFPFRGTEFAGWVLNGLKGVAWLVCLTAATSGIAVWFVGGVEVNAAIFNLGVNPIATAAIMGGFLAVHWQAGWLIMAVWVGTEKGLRECVGAGSPEATAQECTPAQELERECVADYLYAVVVVPAQAPFDRAVAEGVSAVKPL
jgi:hypothetical protein